MHESDRYHKTGVSQLLSKGSVSKYFRLVGHISRASTQLCSHTTKIATDNK